MGGLLFLSNHAWIADRLVAVTHTHSGTYPDVAAMRPQLLRHEVTPCPFLLPDHQKLEREARICRLLKHSNIGEHSGDSKVGGFENAYRDI